MTTPTSIQKTFPLRLASAIAVIVYLVSAYWHIFHGALNPDEGFYAVTTRAVAQGEMPYRDFGFTQPPVVLYANSLPLSVTGFGLFQQRFVNGLWAAAALTLAANWLARQTRLSWGGTRPVLRHIQPLDVFRSHRKDLRFHHPAGDAWGNCVSSDEIWQSPKFCPRPSRRPWYWNTTTRGPLFRTALAVRALAWPGSVCEGMRRCSRRHIARGVSRRPALLINGR